MITSGVPCIQYFGCFQESPVLRANSMARGRSVALSLVIGGRLERLPDRLNRWIPEVFGAGLRPHALASFSTILALAGFASADRGCGSIAVALQVCKCESRIAFLGS